MLSAIFSRTLGFLNNFLQFVTFWGFVNFCIFYVVPSINVIYNVDMICGIVGNFKRVCKCLKPAPRLRFSYQGGGRNAYINLVRSTGGDL